MAEGTLFVQRRYSLLSIQSYFCGFRRRSRGRAETRDRSFSGRIRRNDATRHVGARGHSEALYSSSDSLCLRGAGVEGPRREAVLRLLDAMDALTGAPLSPS